ncbi:amidohydrolase family protein [Burkholderia orbicola]|uniref:amidohydrolase family protein n=1 Tax=Burkholderia orbicola TaxID=2978683 RepID=UPI0035C71E70
MNRIRKIALEEHFIAPGFDKHIAPLLNLMPQGVVSELSRRLDDFDALRLEAMDDAGIAMSVLSLTGPGLQAEPPGPATTRLASTTNDFLAERIERHPKRFAGFATLAMHDPIAAADELERTVATYGFKGALVNGHTKGIYYDYPAYDVFWERLQALDVPFYLHPSDFSGLPQAVVGHPELHGAMWGWGVETATHALRLLFGGVFDRFPNIKIILGHMGEGLPYLRWRYDSRFSVYSHGIELQHKPSEYFGRNIVITTAGVCSPGALAGAVAEMGADAVMFSVDYPYESTALAADFIERAPLDEETRALICHGNAERLLKLPVG